MNNNLSRRRVMQLLATTMAGSIIPATGFSTAFDEEPLNSEKPEPVYIPPGVGHKGKISVNTITFKLNSNQTSGNLASVETTLYPGYMGAVPHMHKGFDEVCRVLQGRVTIMVGDKIYRVEAGGWHLRPRGIMHSFWNDGKVPAKFIELYLPGGHEQYMKDLTTLFANSNKPKPEELDALAKRNDIEFFWDKLPGLLKKYKVRL